MTTAWTLARNAPEKVWRFRQQALQSDVADVQGGTTAEGIHLGAMAGTVDLVLRCLTGMRAHGQVLRFDPAMPTQIKQLRFSVHYRGHRVDLVFSEDRIDISSRPGPAAPITVVVRDQTVELRPVRGRYFLWTQAGTPMAETGLTEHTAKVAAQAHRAAICLDFDGTLAPIVDDPIEARPLPGAVGLLEHLAARFAAVAVISGRPVAYLARHLAAPRVRCLGLYGLQ